MGVSAYISMLILLLPFLYSFVLGQPVQEVCCTKKTVGGVNYNLVEEQDTSGYNCLTSCVFEKEGEPGSRFCFAAGSQPVNCGDIGSDRQLICNYRPKTDVMEHWKLDLDQRDIEYFLGQNDFTSAKDVYGKGANSMKTSGITLASPLAKTFPQGTPVEQGSIAAGALNKKAEIGATTIKVGISTPCISEFGQFPDTSGCFKTAG